MGLCGCRNCMEADAKESARIKAEDHAVKMDRLRRRFPRDVPVGPDAEYRSLFARPSMDTRPAEVGGALRGVCASCPGQPAHPHHGKPAS